MKDKFEFNPDATEYSAVNAYALVRCSELAYQGEDKVLAQIEKWGFPKSNLRFLDKADTQGFAIANDTTAIFAFRGTSSVNDALVDANVRLTNGPLGGLVHEGFARGLNEVGLKMQRSMKKLDNGRRSIWFTGHSLGAALATLAVAERLDTKKPVAGLYTYGSPRVGDKKFRKGFNSRLSNYYRMVYGRDIVTRVAPRALHYTHVGQLTTISRDGKISHKGFSETSFLKKVFHSIEALHKLDFSAIEDHKLGTGYLPMLKKRVGDERTHQADVRIIAATNRDLKQEIEAKRFREDLYYRLNVFPLEIAPLRERKEDIAVLAAHFVDLSARKLNRPLPRLTQANILALQRYDWPGNIRELQNVVERAVITASAGRLRFDLPTDAQPKKPSPADPPQSTKDLAIIPDDEMRRRERDNMLAALKLTKWKISGEDGAAELLGIKPTTLASRMKKMGIERPV